MNRKKDYKDMTKYAKTKKAYYKRYYGKTAIYKPHLWSAAEDAMVLEHSITDHELSEKIGRSVKAIQIRRNRLKKMKED
ncbi:MAG: hypothetical protein SOV90_04780 [Lachnospiraceae bacterium]|nr:hypothetical protein [Lachnospiraceae bacterium]